MDFYRARSLAVNTGAYLFCASLTVAGAALLPRVLPSPRSLEHLVGRDTSQTAVYAAEALAGAVAGLTVSTVLSCAAMGYLEKRGYIGRRR